MIRKVAMLVLFLSFLFLAGNLFFGESFREAILVGNAVAAPCDDSDLKEVNDQFNDVIYPKEKYSTLNYVIPGTVRGLHSLLKIPVTMKDNCASPSKLTEFYCDVQKNVVVSSLVNCSMDSRCYGGACVPLLCEDPDGFDTKKNSSIKYNLASGSKMLSADDYCESSTKLVEYVCQGTVVKWPGGIQNSYPYPNDLRMAVHITCPEGTKCKDGACRS